MSNMDEIKHMLKERVQHDQLAAIVLRIMSKKDGLEEAEKRACICGAKALEINANGVAEALSEFGE